MTNTIQENGIGTEANPHGICTSAHFVQWSQDPNLFDRHFKLMRTIDLSSAAADGFQPIGSDDHPFLGSLDGQGFELSNLHLDQATEDYVGLFGKTNEVEITNLILRNFTITGKEYVGALAGMTSLGFSEVEKMVKISHLDIINAEITGNGYVGGVGGWIQGGPEAIPAQLEQLQVTANISASGNNTGGLAGFFSRSTVLNSSFTGEITSTGNTVGGISGASSNTLHSNLEVDATIEGVSDVGGVSGFVGGWYGTYIDVTATGTVRGTNEKIGGIVGYFYSDGKIKNASFSGTVDGTGADKVGGIVGYKIWAKNLLIQQSQVSGSVMGRDQVGGVVGGLDVGWIVASFSNASVSGRDDVGGLVGNFGGTGSSCFNPNSCGIIHSYVDASSITSTGTRVGGLVGLLDRPPIIKSYATTQTVINTGTHRGGLVGRNEGGDISSSLWNSEATGVSNMCGSSYFGSGCNNSFGYNNSQMQAASTYQGRGFDLTGPGDGISDIWHLEPGASAALYFEFAKPDLSSRFSGGTGTAEDPYLISSASELAQIGHNPWLMNSSFQVTNDINLAGFTSFIGDMVFPFSGTFDGQGFDLYGFDYSNTSKDNVGLFAYVGELILGSFDYLPNESKAIIQNIKMSNAEVHGRDFTAVLVANMASGEIKNIQLQNMTLEGEDRLGGILAGVRHFDVTSLVDFRVKIEDIDVSGTLAATGGDAGLAIGFHNRGTFMGQGFWLQNITTSGSISGQDVVGGVCGTCEGQNLSSSATVLAQEAAGGVAGKSSGGGLLNSFATGDITGTTGVGGLVGTSGAVIRHSYASGTVTGTASVGGLVGTSGAVIRHSYGDITEFSGWI